MAEWKKCKIKKEIGREGEGVAEEDRDTLQQSHEGQQHIDAEE